MAYQVLARKWRPQDFTAVVGQAPIVTALGNALTEGTIAQAYLFSGIRGIGKTSVARLLAKALNCENGPAANPCNDCSTCRDITAGSDLDVIEVDAATYSKVEQIRELTESLRYGPARDRYKVVVLDEIHRLSRQAFDALLKIVEEPPEHLVFIFATTEIEAVPATVLSRCQEFHFRRVPSRELAVHLRTIAEREEIKVSDAALRLIARAGEGSVRDAVALVDQLAIYGSGQISDVEAERVLGGLDSARFVSLLGAIVEGDSARVSELVREVEAEGWDPRQIYTQFLTYCRDALHLSLSGDPAEIDLPREEAATLERLAGQAGYENLLRILHQLLQSESSVRRSEFGALALEIALLRAAELPKLTAIEDLLAGRPKSRERPPAKPRAPKVDRTSTPPESTAPRRSAEPAKKRATSRPRPTPEAEAVQSPEPEAPVPPAPGPDQGLLAPDDAPPAKEVTEGSPEVAKRETPAEPSPSSLSTGDEGRISRVLEQITRERQSLAAHIGTSEKLVFEGGELLIFAPKGDSWLESALSRERNRGILDAAVSSIFGDEAKWRLVEGSSVPPKEEVAAVPSADEAPAAIDHPMVQTVLDVFAGTVESESSSTSDPKDV